MNVDDNGPSEASTSQNDTLNVDVDEIMQSSVSSFEGSNPNSDECSENENVVIHEPSGC